MSNLSYVVESMDSIILRAPDPNQPNQLMTNFLIKPDERLMQLTADPDTSITVNGNSDNIVFQPSSDCTFKIGAGELLYHCTPNTRLWGHVSSDTFYLNFQDITFNNSQLHITTDVTVVSNYTTKFQDPTFQTLVEFNQSSRLAEFHVDQVTVALTRPAPTTQQLFVNETTNASDHTNVCLRSTSASDDPNIIVQPNEGRMTLFTPAQVPGGIQSVSDAYAPPLTLNVFGSQMFNSAWGQTYFYRMGGLYPTQTTGNGFVQLLDATNNVATIDFSAYKQPDQIVQFIGYSAAMMRPDQYSNIQNLYFNDFQEFTGYVDNSSSRLVSIRNSELVRGYNRGRLRWRVVNGRYLRLQIRYDSSFDYTGQTRIYGTLFLVVMTT